MRSVLLFVAIGVAGLSGSSAFAAPTVSPYSLSGDAYSYKRFIGTRGDLAYFMVGNWPMMVGPKQSPSLATGQAFSVPGYDIYGATVADKGYLVWVEKTATGPISAEVNYDPGHEVRFAAVNGSMVASTTTMRATPLELNGKLYLCANDGLYQTDGTPSGTTLVTAIPVGSLSGKTTTAGTIVALGVSPTTNQALLLRTSNCSVGGTCAVDYYTTDGTASGTKRLTATSLPKVWSYFATPAYWLGSNVFVQSLSILTPTAMRVKLTVPWAEQGLSSGSTSLWGATKTRVAFLSSTGVASADETSTYSVPWTGCSSGSAIQSLGGTNVIYVGKSSGKDALCSTDLVGAPVVLKTDLTTTSTEVPAAEAGGYLYFAGFAAASGQELYRTNGTAAGTEMVGDFTPGTASTTFYWVKSVGSTAFALAQTSGGAAIYAISDATSATDGGVSDANVSDANISDANISDANISDANISDANISDANISDANISDAAKTDGGAADAGAKLDAGADSGKTSKVVPTEPEESSESGGCQSGNGSTEFGPLMLALALMARTARARFLRRESRGA